MPVRTLHRLVACLLCGMCAVFNGGCAGSPSDKVLKPVSVLEAKDLVQERSRLLGLGGKSTGAWVDSRQDAEYIAGHIPGAINMPYERVTLEHKSLDQYSIIIVYGGDYNDSRANGMSKRLMELGHGDVRTLTGGLRAWKADGNEVATGQ